LNIAYRIISREEGIKPKAPAFYQDSRYRMMLSVETKPYNPISGKKKHPKLLDSVTRK
jgi:hypothetical protein